MLGLLSLGVALLLFAAPAVQAQQTVPDDWRGYTGPFSGVQKLCTDLESTGSSSGVFFDIVVGPGSDARIVSITCPIIGFTDFIEESAVAEERLNATNSSDAVARQKRTLIVEVFVRPGQSFKGVERDASAWRAVNALRMQYDNSSGQGTGMALLPNSTSGLTLKAGTTSGVALFVRYADGGGTSVRFGHRTSASSAASARIGNAGLSIVSGGAAATYGKPTTLNVFDDALVPAPVLSGRDWCGCLGAEILGTRQASRLMPGMILGLEGLVVHMPLQGSLENVALPAANNTSKGSAFAKFVIWGSASFAPVLPYERRGLLVSSSGGASAESTTVVSENVTVACWVRLLMREDDPAEPTQIPLVGVHSRFVVREFELTLHATGSFSFQVRIGLNSTSSLLIVGASPHGMLLHGRWHHVAASFDGDGRVIRLYIDGHYAFVFADGVHDSGGIVLQSLAYIGRKQNTSHVFTKESGAAAYEISDVRIYDRVATDDEIAAIASVSLEIGDRTYVASRKTVIPGTQVRQRISVAVSFGSNVAMWEDVSAVGNQPNEVLRGVGLGMDACVSSFGFQAGDTDYEDGFVCLPPGLHAFQIFTEKSGFLRSVSALLNWAKCSSVASTNVPATFLSSFGLYTHDFAQNAPGNLLARTDNITMQLSSRNDGLQLLKWPFSEELWLSESVVWLVGLLNESTAIAAAPEFVQQVVSAPPASSLPTIWDMAQVPPVVSRDFTTASAVWFDVCVDSIPSPVGNVSSHVLPRRGNSPYSIRVDITEIKSEVQYQSDNRVRRHWHDNQVLERIARARGVDAEMQLAEILGADCHHPVPDSFDLVRTLHERPVTTGFRRVDCDSSDFSLDPIYGCDYYRARNLFSTPLNLTERFFNPACCCNGSSCGVFRSTDDIQGSLSRVVCGSADEFVARAPDQNRCTAQKQAYETCFAESQLNLTNGSDCIFQLQAFENCSSNAPLVCNNSECADSTLSVYTLDLVPHGDAHRGSYSCLLRFIPSPSLFKITLTLQQTVKDQNFTSGFTVRDLQAVTRSISADSADAVTSAFLEFSGSGNGLRGDRGMVRFRDPFITASYQSGNGVFRNLMAVRGQTRLARSLKHIRPDVSTQTFRGYSFSNFPANSFVLEQLALLLKAGDADAAAIFPVELLGPFSTGQGLGTGFAQDLNCSTSEQQISSFVSEDRIEFASLPLFERRLPQQVNRTWRASLRAMRVDLELKTRSRALGRTPLPYGETADPGFVQSVFASVFPAAAVDLQSYDAVASYVVDIEADTAILLVKINGMIKANGESASSLSPSCSGYVRLELRNEISREIVAITDIVVNGSGECPAPFAVEYKAVIATAREFLAAIGSTPEQPTLQTPDLSKNLTNSSTNNSSNASSTNILDADASSISIDPLLKSCLLRNSPVACARLHASSLLGGQYRRSAVSVSRSSIIEASTHNFDHLELSYRVLRELSDDKEVRDGPEFSTQKQLKLHRQEQHRQAQQSPQEALQPDLSHNFLFFTVSVIDANARVTLRPRVGASQIIYNITDFKRQEQTFSLSDSQRNTLVGAGIFLFVVILMWLFICVCATKIRNRGPFDSAADLYWYDSPLKKLSYLAQDILPSSRAESRYQAKQHTGVVLAIIVTGVARALLFSVSFFLIIFLWALSDDITTLGQLGETNNATAESIQNISAFIDLYRETELQRQRTLADDITAVCVADLKSLERESSRQRSAARKQNFDSTLTCDNALLQSGYQRLMQMQSENIMAVFAEALDEYENQLDADYERRKQEFALLDECLDDYDFDLQEDFRQFVDRLAIFYNNLTDIGVQLDSNRGAFLAELASLSTNIRNYNVLLGQAWTKWETLYSTAQKLWTGVCAKLDVYEVLGVKLMCDEDCLVSEKKNFGFVLTCGSDGPSPIATDIPSTNKPTPLPLAQEPSFDYSEAPSLPPYQIDLSAPESVFRDLPDTEQSEPPRVPKAPSGKNDGPKLAAIKVFANKLRPNETSGNAIASFTDIELQAPGVDVARPRIKLELPDVSLAFLGVLGGLLLLDALLLIRRIVRVMAAVSEAINGEDHWSEATEQLFSRNGRPLNFDPAHKKRAGEYLSGVSRGCFRCAAFISSRVQWVFSKFPQLAPLLDIIIVVGFVIAFFALLVFLVMVILQDGVLENIGYVQAIVLPIDINLQGTNTGIVANAYRINSGELRNLDSQSRQRWRRVFDDTVAFNNDQEDYLGRFNQDYARLRRGTQDKISQYFMEDGFGGKYRFGMPRDASSVLGSVNAINFYTNSQFAYYKSEFPVTITGDIGIQRRLVGFGLPYLLAKRNFWLVLIAAATGTNKGYGTFVPGDYTSGLEVSFSPNSFNRLLAPGDYFLRLAFKVNITELYNPSDFLALYTDAGKTVPLAFIRLDPTPICVLGSSDYGECEFDRKVINGETITCLDEDAVPFVPIEPPAMDGILFDDFACDIEPGIDSRLFTGFDANVLYEEVAATYSIYIFALRHLITTALYVILGFVVAFLLLKIVGAIGWKMLQRLHAIRVNELVLFKALPRVGNNLTEQNFDAADWAYLSQYHTAYPVITSCVSGVVAACTKVRNDFLRFLRNAEASTADCTSNDEAKSDSEFFEFNVEPERSEKKKNGKKKAQHSIGKHLHRGEDKGTDHGLCDFDLKPNQQLPKDMLFKLKLLATESENLVWRLSDELKGLCPTDLMQELDYLSRKKLPRTWAKRTQKVDLSGSDLQATHSPAVHILLAARALRTTASQRVIEDIVALKTAALQFAHAAMHQADKIKMRTETKALLGSGILTPRPASAVHRTNHKIHH